MVISQPNLQNRTNNTHYTKFTPTNNTNPDSRNEFTLRQQVQDNYYGSKTLFDNATRYSVSKPKLFKSFNDVSQEKPPASLPTSMYQPDPIVRNKIVGSDGISLPSSQLAVTPAINARNIQTRNDQNRQMRLQQALGQDKKDYQCEENGNINNIKPKKLDIIQPVFDFKQKRRTMDSIFKTVSEHEIIGLQNHGNQGNASMKGSFNDNHHSINQRPKQHQQYVDRKTSDDYIMRETNKINKIYDKEELINKNQGSPISQTSHQKKSFLKKEIKFKQLKTDQKLDNHEELPLLSRFILKQTKVPLLTNSNMGYQNQNSQDQQQNLINQRILKSSDPIHLLLLRDALYYNESQIKTHKIQNINRNAHKKELSTPKQLQTLDGILMKQADLQFNGQNYSQYNVLIKHDPHLNQNRNRKINLSREPSIYRSPIITNESNKNKEETKFNIGNNEIVPRRQSIMKTHQTISLNQQEQAGYCFENLGELDSSIKQKYFISESQVQQEALKKQQLIQIIEEIMQKRTDVREQENYDIPGFQQKVTLQSEKQQTPKKVFSNKNINKFFRNDTLPLQYDFQAQEKQNILDQSFYDSNQNLYGLTQSNQQNHSLEENSLNQENYSNFMSRKQSQQLDNFLQTINGNYEIYSNEIHPHTTQIRMNSQIFIDDGQFCNKLLTSENREFQEPSFRNYYKNENMFIPQDQLQRYDMRQDHQQSIVQNQLCQSPIQNNTNLNHKHEEILQKQEHDFFIEIKQQKQERDHTINEEIQIDNQIIKEENILPEELSQKPTLTNGQSDDLAQKQVFIKKITKKLTIQSETIVTQNKEEETKKINQNPKKKILNKVRILNKINNKQNNKEQEATAIKMSNYDQEMMMLQKEIIEKLASIQEQINLQQKQINFQKFIIGENDLSAPVCEQKQLKKQILPLQEQVQETQLVPDSAKVHIQAKETQDIDAKNKAPYSNQDSINERQSQSPKHQDLNDQKRIQKSPIKTKADFQKSQKKSLIVLKNNPDSQELSPNQDSSPQTKTQQITTITMLAPTMDALLNPIIQEIVNKDDNEIHLKEKLFKKGRKTTGKRIFAQNILLKLVKPRKEPDELDSIREEKTKEEQEIEELKAQSQNTPKPPCGKKRYVDYLIEQNESPAIKNLDSALSVQNNQKSAQQIQNFNIRRQNEMKRPDVESNINSNYASDENFEKSPIKRQNSSHLIQDKKILNLDSQFFSQNQIEESSLRKTQNQEKRLSHISSSMSPKPQEQTLNSQNCTPKSDHTSQKLTSRSQKGILKKFKSVFKKKLSTKYIAPAQISNNQEILNQSPYLITDQQQTDNILQNTLKRLPTIAIAKIPERRKTYGGRPRKSEVQIQIFPQLQQSLINQVQVKAQENSVQLSQNRNKITTPNIGQFLKRYSNINRKYSSNVGETGTNSQIIQPQIKQLSPYILAPPEFKHSNIDIEIIKTTLDSSVAINQQKKLNKKSTKKPETFNFNQLMIDQLDSESQDAQKQIQGQLKQKNISPQSPMNNLSPIHNQSFKIASPQNKKSPANKQYDQLLKPKKSSEKVLIMPKSKSSNNFLEAQQLLQTQQHTKFHIEGTLQPKNSNKILPKCSAKSISNIGKFMRAGHGSNGLGNHEFVVGQMHGKMF